MTRRLAGPVGLMLAGLLVGCGGTAETDEPPVSSSATSQEAASSPADAGVHAAVALPHTTAFEDAAADSTGVLDLITVGLVPGPDEVQVSYSWAGDVPSVGSVL